MKVAEFGVSSLKEAEQTRRAITLKLFTSIILDTPVDTGRLRGNWRTQVDAPKLQVIARDDKGGGAATQEAVENLGDGTGKDIGVYFTNSLPYAAGIEYEGRSKKAPEGMVRRNIARIKALVRRAVQEGRL